MITWANTSLNNSCNWPNCAAHEIDVSAKDQSRSLVLYTCPMRTAFSVSWSLMLSQSQMHWPTQLDTNANISFLSILLLRYSHAGHQLSSVAVLKFTESLFWRRQQCVYRQRKWAVRGLHVNQQWIHLYRRWKDARDQGGKNWSRNQQLLKATSPWTFW